MSQPESVVVFSTSGMGHLIPVVELSKQFVAHGFSVTIAVATPTFDISSTIDPFIARVSSDHKNISFRCLPKPNFSKHQYAFHFETLRHASAHLLDFLKEEKSTSNIRALILDLFCIPGLDVGEALGIPTYFFYTTNAVILVLWLSFPYLQSKMKGSFRDLGDGAKINLPGIPPISVADLPDGIADRDEANEELMLELEKVWRADGVMINTFEWLEKRAVEALAHGVIVPGRKTPAVYCIGPLIGDGRKGEERHECLAWLDSQPEKSVVFLCFGSNGAMPKEQVREIAIGIERSRQRFLWVVRGLPMDRTVSIETTDPDLEALLPEGFLERTRMRGMVLKSWAPQTAVLNHASTGAFFSHCGWNSSLEGVTAGIPIIAWPLGAEQATNKHMLVEEAKMAVAIEKSDHGMVSAEEVERKIRLLMQSEVGRVIRNRAAEGKQKAAEAWKEDGSTTLAWMDLVGALRKDD